MFFVSVCYGNNSTSIRQALWNSLSSISLGIANPWLVLGDFNSVRWSWEKKGGAAPIHSAMQDFNDCLDNCGLKDFPMVGPAFTWSNSSFGASRVECKLDRVFGNQSFFQSSLCLNFEVLNPLLSDHSPMLITSIAGAKHPFKFFNA